MSGVTFRAANPADAPGIARVHVESWQHTYRDIIPDAFLATLSTKRREAFWSRALSEPELQESVFVALDPAGQIVGFASGGLERSGDPLHRGELYALYVMPAFQRKGLGRSLVGLIVDRLAQRSIRSILVWVLAANPRRAFYEHLGGQQLRQRTIEIGGVLLEEVAYGWPDAPATFSQQGTRQRGS